jgi:hypothetical protein
VSGGYRWGFGVSKNGVCSWGDPPGGETFSAPAQLV